MGHQQEGRHQHHRKLSLPVKIKKKPGPKPRTVCGHKKDVVGAGQKRRLTTVMERLSTQDKKLKKKILQVDSSSEDEGSSEIL